MLMIYKKKNSKEIFGLISLSSFLQSMCLFSLIRLFRFQKVKEEERDKDYKQLKETKWSYWYYYAGFCEGSNFMDCIHCDLNTESIGFLMYFEFLCFLKILFNKLYYQSQSIHWNWSFQMEDFVTHNTRVHTHTHVCESPLQAFLR